MYKIMIIEDDVAIQKELSQLLETQGYQVCVWNLKEDLLSFLKKEEAHVILLDINLPKEDGFTLCTMIRTQSNVPMLLPLVYILPLLHIMDMLFTNLPGNSSIYLACLISFLLYVIVYFCYYLLAYQGCKQNLEMEG